MRTWFKIVGWVGGILAAICLAFYIFLVDVWRVPTDDPMESASIAPTLDPGDLVLVTRHTTVARGNLLRCPDPQAPGRFVIARAVASPGETMELNGEVLTVDRTRMPSPRACEPNFVIVHDPQSNEDVRLDCGVEEFGERDFSVLHSGQFPEPPTKMKVANGWYLLSDDRHIHVDSRDFGTIDTTTCQHIVFRLVGASGFSDQKKRLSFIW